MRDLSFCLVMFLHILYFQWELDKYVIAGKTTLSPLYQQCLIMWLLEKWFGAEDPRLCPFCDFTFHFKKFTAKLTIEITPASPRILSLNMMKKDSEKWYSKVQYNSFQNASIGKCVIFMKDYYHDDHYHYILQSVKWSHWCTTNNTRLSHAF